MQIGEHLVKIATLAFGLVLGICDDDGRGQIMHEIRSQLVLSAAVQEMREILGLRPAADTLPQRFAESPAEEGLVDAPHRHEQAVDADAAAAVQLVGGAAEDERRKSESLLISPVEPSGRPLRQGSPGRGHRDTVQPDRQAVQGRAGGGINAGGTQ